MTMINNFSKPYYYCLESFYYAGDHFNIGWEYPVEHITRYRDIDKSKFKFIS